MPTIMKIGVGVRYEQSGCGVTISNHSPAKAAGFPAAHRPFCCGPTGLRDYCGGVVFALMLSGQAAFADRLAPGRPAATIACATTPTQAPVVLATSGSAAGTYAGVLLTGAQVDAANTVVNVGLDEGITRRGIAIAIAAAMQASSLRPTAVQARLRRPVPAAQRRDVAAVHEAGPVGSGRCQPDVLRPTGRPRARLRHRPAFGRRGRRRGPGVRRRHADHQLAADGPGADRHVRAGAPAAPASRPRVEPAVDHRTAIVPLYALANPLPLRGSGVAFRADPTDPDAPSTTAPTTDPVAAPCTAEATDPTTTTDAVSTSESAPDRRPAPRAALRTVRRRQRHHDRRTRRPLTPPPTDPSSADPSSTEPTTTTTAEPTTTAHPDADDHPAPRLRRTTSH